MSVMLKNIATIAAGQGAPQGDENYCDNGTPFVKAGNLAELLEGRAITEIQKVSDEVAKLHKLKLYKKGSVLFAKSGMSCLKGYVYVLPQDAYVVSHLACVTPHEDISDYLGYYFQYNRPNKLVKDEAYPSISLNDIGELQIDIKSQSERKNIVRNLRAVEQLIKLQKLQLQEFETLIKSRFVEMFGDPLDKDRVNYYFTECVEFNPKKSEVKDMQDVEVSFVPMECVGVDGSFTIKETGLVQDYYSGYTYFRDGDVLLAKITPCFENGKVAIAAECMNGIGFGTTEFHVSRPLKGLTNSTWIKYLLKNDIVHDLATINMSGSAGQKRIQTPFFNKLRIYVPPIEEQEQFSEFVKQVTKLKFEVQKSLDETQTLMDSLMQQYFG